MSAWIVSKRHIDYMVTAIIHAELACESPDELGRMLWGECLASVAWRYPHHGDGERPGPAEFCDGDVAAYIWEETPLLTDGGLAKTLGCYRYQSCEHPGWEGSQACALTGKLIGSLGDVEDDESVPWGWD